MRHVLTFIASPATVKPLGQTVTRLAARFAGMPIRWLADCVACDVELEYALTSTEFNALRDAAAVDSIDCVMQPLDYRDKSLLISDMDSTMIEQECIDELADCVGLKAHVAAITERAMNGELDFKDALRERVALLKDLPEEKLAEVFATRIKLMPGAATLIATMKSRGATTVLVSGGFSFFTGRVAIALGFDREEANSLLIEDGKLTGLVAEPILDKESKRATLLRIAAEKRIPLACTLAVGDGANDLPMLLTAGLGVAYHAKPVVMAQARAAIRFNDLSALLYLQGIEQKHWIAA